MKLLAAIFDLDGTVISDEDEWGEAFNKILKRLGVEPTSAYPQAGGIGIEENWKKFITKYNIKTEKPIRELTQETKLEFVKLIPRIDLTEGFVEFVTSLRSHGVKISLATSSTWDIVEIIFDNLQIERFFDNVTTGEEVTYKKPDPQLFELASEKIGVYAENCCVFEDSDAGIKAAESAGMKVVGISNRRNSKEELEKADLTVTNFTHISYEDLLKL